MTQEQIDQMQTLAVEVIDLKKEINKLKEIHTKKFNDLCKLRDRCDHKYPNGNSAGISFNISDLEVCQLCGESTKEQEY